MIKVKRHLASVRRMTFAGVGRWWGEMAEEGGRVGGGEEAGKLIITSSNGPGEGDRTWAREVPEF